MTQNEINSCKSLFAKTRNRLLKRHHPSLVTRLMRMAVANGKMHPYFGVLLDSQRKESMSAKKARNRFKNSMSLRRKVYERFEGRCLDCLAEKSLIIHHLKPVSTHPHLSTDVANLALLCRKCHHKRHSGSYPQE